MERPWITVPERLMRITGVDWNIDWREQSAGMGTGGRRNVLLNALPRWTGSLPVELPASLLGQWRAMRLHGQGLLAIYRVRMVDPAINTLQALSAASFSDGAVFDGGATVDNWPMAPCRDGAPAGATEIVIDETGMTTPVAVGQILSHGDWPFAVSWREDLGSGQVRLGVQMPLRAAIEAGDLVDLIGVGLFELTQSPGPAAYQRRRRATPQLSLQEWLR